MASKQNHAMKKKNEGKIFAMQRDNIPNVKKGLIKLEKTSLWGTGSSLKKVSD